MVGGGVVSNRSLARRRISSGSSGVVGSIVRGRDLRLATVRVSWREREVGSGAEPGTSVTLYSSED